MEVIMERTKDLATRGIALMMAMAMIASCALPQSGPGAVDREALLSASSRMIDENLELVMEYISDELPEARSLEGCTGYDIASRTLAEENGEKYLEFMLKTDSYESVDEVFAATEGLVSEEELAEVKARIAELEENLYTEAEDYARALSPSQKKEFYKDLQKLVVKSAVLLTAAIVYACVPHVVFWGKVTAASAVAIAAGILAVSIMSIVGYYKGLTEKEESFSDWLSSVTTEPAANWAIAAAMISSGKAISQTPVMTALILAVFAIYGIIDDVKPMLKKYNFSI